MRIAQIGLNVHSVLSVRSYIFKVSFCYKDIRFRWRFVNGCGAGGDWTLVQTGTSCAFYTLISDLSFRAMSRPEPPGIALSPKNLRPSRGAASNYPWFCCATWPEYFGEPVSERHLVPAPGAGIKPHIYYSSIRQRERSCFRQINFRMSCIIESGKQLSACLHNTSSCCQIQSAPWWCPFHFRMQIYSFCV